MNLIDFYYDFNVGEYPENIDNRDKTKKIFEYLLEAGITESELVDLIIREFENKDYLTYSDLPNKLWDKSLLKRDVFYYHRELQVLSPAPTWEETFPFYREMRIIYTEKDILNYFAKVFAINSDWLNEAKELGSIKYLLDKYKMFSFVESIDFLLMLIDYLKANDVKINKIYDICNYEVEFAKILEVDVKNSELKKKNTIVWR